MECLLLVLAVFVLICYVILFVNVRGTGRGIF